MIVNKQQFPASAGLEVRTLEFWIEQQWLIPDPTAPKPASRISTWRART